MDFYITDRKFKLKTIVSTHGSTPVSVIDAVDTSVLSTASRNLKLTLGFKKQDSALIKKLVSVGDYVLYVDPQNNYIWQTIMSVEHNPLMNTRTIECESASIDLINETVSEYKATQPYTIQAYIERFVYDSGWVIGINEIPNLTRTLEWEGEATCLERILSVATQFDNAELEFSFEFNGNNLIQRKINILKKRGRKTDIKLYINKDINSIITKENIYDLHNALIIKGGTPEGSDKPVDLKGYKWTDPDGRFLLRQNDGMLFDLENVQYWSRTNTKSNWIVRYKTYTSTDKKSLLNDGISELKKYSSPITEYEVDIANIDVPINLGDTLNIVDEYEELFLSSRCQKIEYNYTTNNLNVELSDFKIIESGLSKELQNLANSFKDEMNKNKVYTVEITPSQPFFVNGEGTITLSAAVKENGYDVTSSFTTFTWSRYKLDGSLDEWSQTGQTINITADTELRYTYNCVASNQEG
ncbi:hypothetical protein EF36P1_00010 [Enterococcus phage EF36P1]|nr:hypothetical protein EF36P1_00010 [Enterococcus phage EF36P1]WAX14929.1 hypothetical protein EF36P2_00052 [Enterococcus phage EF36P2]WAX15001.1 hypothetical protein EF36P3_00062 [Enterococcus phage EF36P3]